MYCCVASDILTDDVIITEKQIQHISNSHPGVLHSRIFHELSMAVAQPDYILQDAQAAHISDTAIVMKKIHREDGGYRVILRLATSSDDKEKKNSIIMAFYISEKVSVQSRQVYPPWGEPTSRGGYHPPASQHVGFAGFFAACLAMFVFGRIISAPTVICLTMLVYPSRLNSYLKRNGINICETR